MVIVLFLFFHLFAAVWPFPAICQSPRVARQLGLYTILLRTITRLRSAMSYLAGDKARIRYP